MKIIIIGCGIIGLSSGVRILESFPTADVMIYAEQLPPNTTGNVAAGLWRPYSIDLSDPRVEKWGDITYNYLTDMISQCPDHHARGVFYEDIYEVSKSGPVKQDFFNRIVGNTRTLNSREMKRFPNATHGVCYTTIMAEGTKMINYMLERYLKLGGQLKQQKITSIDELQSAENCDFIINCAGVRAAQLCDDTLAYPIRGQIVIVNAPWLKFGAMDDKSYVFPQSTGNVVLGGTKQKNNWSLEINKDDIDSILKGCYSLVPGLKSCSIVDHKVGLRPGRDLIRLELELKRNSKSGSAYKIIHNYGHGGSGLTLFWGSAADVTDLIRKERNPMARL